MQATLHGSQVSLGRGSTRRYPLSPGHLHPESICSVDGGSSGHTHTCRCRCKTKLKSPARHKPHTCPHAWATVRYCKGNRQHDKHEGQCTCVRTNCKTFLADGAQTQPPSTQGNPFCRSHQWILGVKHRAHTDMLSIMLTSN